MACNSRENTIKWFVNKNILSATREILDLNKFNMANVVFTERAINEYGLNTQGNLLFTISESETVAEYTKERTLRKRVKRADANIVLFDNLDKLIEAKETREANQRPDAINENVKEVKEGVEDLFESNPELASIGTPEQYSAYLDTIFPDSQVKDIVYHGSKYKFEKFDKSKLGSNTNPNKEFPQFNDSYLGFHFTSNPEYYRSRFEFGSKYEKNLNEYIAILNIQKPKDIADKDEFSQNNIQFIKPEDVKNNDSIIYDYLDTVDFSSGKKVNKYTNNYVVFEPEQIHILGNKQDIEGFKKFVSKPIQLTQETTGYERLIKDTLLNVFYKKSSSFVIDLYRDLVLLNKNENIKSLMHEFNNPDGIFVSKKLDEDGATLLYGSIINYVSQKSIDYNSSLFYGENTVARKVLNIQKDENHLLHNNYVIKNIFNPEIGNGNNIPDIISITNKSIDQKESDYINQSFAQIKELDNNLYNDLITLSFYQTGMVASPVNYYQLLPYNDSLTLANQLIKKHDLVIPDMYTLAKEIMENIGTKLPNIQKVSYKEGDNNFGKVLELKADRTRGKEYIVYYRDKQSALYKLKNNNTYVMVENKNYKSLFYNYSTNANEILTTEPEVIENIVDEGDVEVKELKPKETNIKLAWDNLTLQQMTNLGKVGVTKEEFNNLTIEEQNNLKKCHG